MRRYLTVDFVGGLGRDEFFAVQTAPAEPSLCWDVKVGWVPVRAIDPATGRCYVDDSAPTYEAPE